MRRDWYLAPINREKEDLVLKYLGEIVENLEGVNIDWTSFAEYLTKIESVGIASNMMLFLGHGMIRVCTMGFDDREPSNEELETMKEYTKEAMEAGAIGLSTGLYYPPGLFAKTDEIIELCKVVSEYNGYYSSHIRSYGSKLIESFRETVDIGKKANLPVQISHMSIFDKPLWGVADNVLAYLEEVRESGIEINCDMHPYDSVLTWLEMLLPPWVFEGGPDKVVEWLKDPSTREQIKHEQIHGREGWSERVPIHRIGKAILPILLSSEKYKPYEGTSILEIANKVNMDMYDTIYDILIEEKTEAAMIITHLRGEEDMIHFMKSNFFAFETDGNSVAPYGEISKQTPHPRFYGTYPKIFGEYVREKKVLTLETAIRKCTSLPAQMIGLRDRGMIREGNWADFVIFDPKTIIDTATYANPHQYPIGINYVIINGEVVLENGNYADVLPGKVLRHTKR